MSLLQFKRKRNRISGKFSYGLKNSLVFSRTKNKWFLRLPKEILRFMKLHVGSLIDASSDGEFLIIVKKNMSKKYAARRRIRVRLKKSLHPKR